MRAADNILFHEKMQMLNSITTLSVNYFPGYRLSAAYSTGNCLVCINPLWHKVKIRWTVTIKTKIKCQNFSPALLIISRDHVCLMQDCILLSLY